MKLYELACELKEYPDTEPGKKYLRKVNEFIFQLGEYFRDSNDIISLQCLSARYDACAFPLGIDFPQDYFFNGETPQYIDNLLKSQPVALYGAGMFGEVLAHRLLQDKVNVSAFIDKGKSGSVVLEIPVYDYNSFRLEYPDVTIIISSGAYYKEIYDFLQEHNDSNIVFTSAYIPWKYRLSYEDDIMLRILTSYVKPLMFKMCMSSGTQYFPDEIDLTDDETFVDCGVFNGEDCETFYRLTGGRGRVFGFEPCYDSFVISKNIYDKYPNAKLYNAGVSDENDRRNFFSAGGTANIMARFSEKGNEIAETVRLDDVLSGQRVTYIKMDIEGYELAALKGAESLLRKYKPKLAISVYHKLEDIWEIPAYILSLNLGYKLFLRHYRVFSADTVLYCI